jgi:hypothetical protein
MDVRLELLPSTPGETRYTLRFPTGQPIPVTELGLPYGLPTGYASRTLTLRVAGAAADGDLAANTAELVILETDTPTEPGLIPPEEQAALEAATVEAETLARTVRT